MLFPFMITDYINNLGMDYFLCLIECRRIQVGNINLNNFLVFSKCSFYYKFNCLFKQETFFLLLFISHFEFLINEEILLFLINYLFGFSNAFLTLEAFSLIFFWFVTFMTDTSIVLTMIMYLSKSETWNIIVFLIFGISFI